MTSSPMPCPVCVWPGLGEPAITIVAYGDPAPQGSKRARPVYKGRGAAREFTGRVALQETSAKVKPWREAVHYAALRAARKECAARGLASWPPLDGPLVAELAFTLHRGTTVQRAHHTVYPDLSKLVRSTEDALTTARIWADDARVVAYHAPRKMYVGAPDPDALDRPGAVIRVWALPE